MPAAFTVEAALHVNEAFAISTTWAFFVGGFGAVWYEPFQGSHHTVFPRVDVVAVQV